MKSQVIKTREIAGKNFALQAANLSLIPDSTYNSLSTMTRSVLWVQDQEWALAQHGVAKTQSLKAVYNWTLNY